MQQFYKERLSRHQTKLIRYLKYVFNDHVVLISSFLLGGFGLYYSDLVKTLDSSFILGKPLVALIWLMALFTGRLATLMKEADKIFLLPKERQMVDYLKAAYRHSLLLPFSLLLITVGVAMPLLVAVAQTSLLDFALFILMLWLLKASHLMQQFNGCFLSNDAQEKKDTFIWMAFAIVAILSALYLYSGAGLMIAILCLALQTVATKKTFATQNLDWERMINHEQQRMKRIYQFINMFTDVPGISGKVKRRKIFDGLLNNIKKTHKNTYLYLYSRSFLRGAEYSGLFIRLTLVGTIVLVFLNEFMLVLIVSLVIIYLIGFQMIPMYGQFDYMVMTELYPLTSQDKKAAVNTLVRVLLLIVGSVFSLLALLVLPNKLDSLMVIGAILGEILVFTALYLPSRLRKIDRF
ncbi:ABC transporter permease [Vagococcus sp. BWB3-3]|uniref:ABC transporter permease n=1 Tax=Vagococcus allomyrinae TaxID=2794353 RepID=A0A940P9A5_9ENTE|nr:ABC transporter permease [Vagococcus allomyrinae]MBP1039873.1 ABC transporter permease [Vagococcus allomyrinae]